jgi:hypothetical protein
MPDSQDPELSATSWSSELAPTNLATASGFSPYQNSHSSFTWLNWFFSSCPFVDFFTSFPAGSKL